MVKKIAQRLSRLPHLAWRFRVIIIIHTINIALTFKFGSLTALVFLFSAFTWIIYVERRQQVRQREERLIAKRKTVEDQARLWMLLRTMENACIDAIIKEEPWLQQCQTCLYYHGKDDVVCAPHPSGSATENCPDWVSKSSYI